MKKLSDEEKAWLGERIERAQAGIRNVRLGSQETPVYSRVAQIVGIIMLSLGALWFLIALVKIDDNNAPITSTKKIGWDFRVHRKYIQHTGGTYEGDSPPKTYYCVARTKRGSGTALPYSVWKRVRIGDYVAVKGTKVFSKNKALVGWSKSKALALASSGRLEEALAFIDKALELNPGSDWARRDKGLLLWRKMGRYAEAKEYLKESDELVYSYSQHARW